jgi:hypothetical protein
MTFRGSSEYQIYEPGSTNTLQRGVVNSRYMPAFPDYVVILTVYNELNKVQHLEMITF